MIQYHSVTSFDISYSAIACSHAYLVILVSCIWLRLNKHSGKEEKKKDKKEAFKQENDQKLISKEWSMKQDTYA